MDLVSLQNFKDFDPTEIIYMVIEQKGKKEIYCASEFSLNLQSLSYMTTMKKWIKNPLSSLKEIDKEGRGGMADQKSPDIIKIPHPYHGYPIHIEKQGVLDAIYNRCPIIVIREPPETYRIGNKDSRFGVSEQHGQLPPENIYKVEQFPLAELRKMIREKV
jgi:hypothetical protein